MLQSKFSVAIRSWWLAPSRSCRLSGVPSPRDPDRLLESWQVRHESTGQISAGACKICTIYAELPQITNHLSRPALCAIASHFRPAFLIWDAFVQNHPDQPAESMSNGSDGLCVPQSYDKPAIYELKDAAFGFDSGICGLIEHISPLEEQFRGNSGAHPRR